MHQVPDFQALFRASPYPYLLVDRALVIIGASDAYLNSTGRTEADIVGRYIFDAFPANPDDPDSTNVDEVRGSIERAIATGRPDTTAFLRYSIPRQGAAGTVFEERFWSTVHTPIMGPDGEVAFVSQNAIDVTDLYRFDRNSQSASVAPALGAEPDVDNFSRAQMHEAMHRILNDERSHLRNLFNQAPGFIAILSGPNHVFEMANEAYYQLVGHRQIVGKAVWDALPEVRGQGFDELLDSVYQGGKPFVGRGMRFGVQRHPGGPTVERHIDLLYQPLFGKDGQVTGIFVQGHDVSEAHAAQLSKRETDERLAEGMIAARMVVWDLDLASRTMVFSDNAAAVLGHSETAIDAITRLMHPDDALRLSAARERAIATKSGYEEIVRFERPGDAGGVAWFDIRGKVRCDADGNAFSVRGVTLDVTERMRAEEELRDAHRRKDEFLAMLAHELRNPLAPINSAAQLMRHARLDEARLRQAADIIVRQVGHITGLVDDLIDVSRVTRGLISTDRKPYDIQRIIADAVEQVRPSIDARRQRLEIAVPDQPAAILGDHKRLVQVLTNLLSNAARYTPEGGAVALRLAVHDTEIELSVADDGIGIAPQLLPRVFDLFTQGERSADRAQGGLGVGLAVVKSLVELHGGRVAAASDGPGRGSVFTVTLPRLGQGGAAGAGAAAGAPATGAARPLRLMVVDDNADSALMLSMLLEASGYAVSVDYSSRAALARAQAETPDACLLDIGLPDMDGHELARRIRALPAMAGAMLVAITGYGQEQDRASALAAGFDHHLVKPVNLERLKAILDARAGQAANQATN